VARPGAVLLMLVPDWTPLSPRTAELPEPLRWEEADDPHWARPAIERRLTGAANIPRLSPLPKTVPAPLLPQASDQNGHSSGTIKIAMT
jgi:hypothetical protein